MLQSYHHITERSKYIREFERQKMFLEFFSEYTFEYTFNKIVSLTVGSHFMYTNHQLNIWWIVSYILHIMHSLSGIYMGIEYNMVMSFMAGTRCWIFMFSLQSSTVTVVILNIVDKSMRKHTSSWQNKTILVS